MADDNIIPPIGELATISMENLTWSDTKVLPNVRFVERTHPDNKFMKIKVLQQAHEIIEHSMGGVSSQRIEWRDVPTVKEE